MKQINSASRCKIWNYCGYSCVYTQRNVQKSIESLKYSTRLAFKRIKRIFVGTSVSFIAFAKCANLHKAPQPSNNRNCREVTKCHERGKTTRGGRRVYNRAYVYIYIYVLTLLQRDFAHRSVASGHEGRAGRQAFAHKSISRVHSCARRCIP